MVDQHVTITYEQVGGLTPPPTKPSTPGGAAIGSGLEAEGVDGGTGEGGGGAGSSGAMASARGGGGGGGGGGTGGNPRVSVDEYLVCAGLGGGLAKEMAVHPKNQALKFIPWAGVAAHLKHNGSFMTHATKGQAFCFLPLPKDNGVPVSGGLCARVSTVHPSRSPRRPQ